MKKIYEYILVATEIIVQFATQSSEKLTRFFKNKFNGYAYLTILIWVVLQITDFIYTVKLGIHVYHLSHELHFLVEGVSSQGISELLFAMFELDFNTIYKGKQVIGRNVKIKPVRLKTSFHKLPKRLLFVFIIMTIITYLTTGYISFSLLIHDFYYCGKEFSIQKLAHSQLDTIESAVQKVRRFIKNLFEKI